MNFSVRTAILDDAEAAGRVHTASWKTTYAGIVHQSFLDAIDLNKRIQAAKNRINNPNTDSLVLIESRKFYEKMGGRYIGADHVDIEEHRYPTSTYLWDLR